MLPTSIYLVSSRSPPPPPPLIYLNFNNLNFKKKIKIKFLVTLLGYGQVGAFAALANVACT